MFILYSRQSRNHHIYMPDTFMDWLFPYELLDGQWKNVVGKLIHQPITKTGSNLQNSALSLHSNISETRSKWSYVLFPDETKECRMALMDVGKTIKVCKNVSLILHWREGELWQCIAVINWPVTCCNMYQIEHVLSWANEACPN